MTRFMDNLIPWVGQLHPMLLHFPIALIMAAVVAELLYLWKPLPLYDHAARFMVLGAAIMVVPTVLTGLAFSESMTYEGPEVTLFFWHRFFGFLTLILALFTAFVREQRPHTLMYACALITVNISCLFVCYFGGRLTFG